MNGDQLWQELAAAPDEAGLRVTFDPERIACPACGAACDAECRVDCGLHGLSRLPEPCDDCGGDMRLCNCFMRYEERGEPAEEMDDDDGID